MTIDCRRCQARGIGCADCAATALLEPARPEGPAPGADYLDLDPAELRALTALANAGMIAPLRYAPRLAQAS